jgi:hypothetical protein
MKTTNGLTGLTPRTLATMSLVVLATTTGAAMLEASSASAQPSIQHLTEGTRNGTAAPSPFIKVDSPLPFIKVDSRLPFIKVDLRSPFIKWTS